MRTSPPTLLPLLRSQTQGVLLATVLLNPDREFSLTQLADESGLAFSTVAREVDRAASTGLLTTRHAGRTKLVSVDRNSPLYAPMSQLIQLTFGPLAAIRETFRDLPRTKAVFIFGSWASRYTGEVGPPPNDVDVLVIGDPPRGPLFERAREAEQHIGQEIQVTVRSEETWEADPPEGFVATVRQRPLVQVVP
jgi:predicted nucleotidyltransferase